MDNQNNNNDIKSIKKEKETESDNNINIDNSSQIDSNNNNATTTTSRDYPMQQSILQSELSVASPPPLVSSPYQDPQLSSAVSPTNSPPNISTISLNTKSSAMVEDPSIQHLISWAPSGDVFSVSNPTEFSKLVLPQYFKHNNWQSFVRQLNMYGFHKVNDMFHANPSSESQAWEFKHQDFRRGQPAALQLIKRKSSKHSTNSLRDDRIEYLTNQMKELKEKTRQITENYKVLYDESLSFRMLQSKHQQVITIITNLLVSMAKEVDFLQAEVAKLAQVDPPSHSSSMIPHYTHPYTPQRTLSTPQPMIGVESAAPPPPSQQQPSEMDYRMTQQQQQQSSSSSSPYPSQHSRTPKINPPSALAKLPEFPFAPSPFQPTSSTSGNLPIIRHRIINKSSSSLPSSQTRPPPLPDPPDNSDGSSMEYKRRKRS
ncbi:21677_t:CDS:2 [Entrophospora sp. SA101]|nr:21673_t:CDS:2 [Entrophospora sp. SA101]CAJ0870288.1 21677_t:CDS:2 [Entrophospora sp. SA101]